MKKLFFVAAVAVVALSSCKKDYTCTYEEDFFGTTTTFTAACTACSSSDVDDLEATGYTCVAD